jgi:hypothetical protein
MGCEKDQPPDKGHRAALPASHSTAVYSRRVAERNREAKPYNRITEAAHARSNDAISAILGRAVQMLQANVDGLVVGLLLSRGASPRAPVHGTT